MEERKGYQDPYASEDIKRMREMYDHAIRKLVGGYSGTGEVDVIIKASRLMSLPPEILHEISGEIGESSTDTVLIRITLGDGDSYNVTSVTDEGGEEFHGTMSKTDIIHVLNEVEVMPND